MTGWLWGPGELLWDRSAGGADGIKKTTGARLAVCLSFDSKIVAVDFLFVCIKRYEFGV